MASSYLTVSSGMWQGSRSGKSEARWSGHPILACEQTTGRKTVTHFRLSLLVFRISLTCPRFMIGDSVLLLQSHTRCTHPRHSHLMSKKSGLRSSDGHPQETTCGTAWNSPWLTSIHALANKPPMVLQQLQVMMSPMSKGQKCWKS